MLNQREWGLSDSSLYVNISLCVCVRAARNGNDTLCRSSPSRGQGRTYFACLTLN